MQIEPSNPFPAARGSAHKWRGECISCFAEVEQRLSALLIRSHNTPTYAALKPAFPHLVGQKFARLRKLLELEGPLKQRAAHATDELDAFAQHDDLRTLLCHGELEVGITENESRIYLFKVRNFRNKIAGVATTAFSQSDADARRNELKASVESMLSELAALEKLLPRAAPVPAKT